MIRVGPEIANHFSAHPDIAPHVGGPIDFTGATQATFIFGLHGGFCFEPTGPGEYEAHIMITRAGRGRWAWRAAQEALALLGAERVWGRATERHLIAFALRAGFREAEPMPPYRIFEWRRECPQQ